MRDLQTLPDRLGSGDVRVAGRVSGFVPLAFRYEPSRIRVTSGGDERYVSDRVKHGVGDAASRNHRRGLTRHSREAISVQPKRPVNLHNLDRRLQPGGPQASVLPGELGG